MRAYTRRRAIASVKLGIAAIPFSVGLTLAHGQPIVPGTFITGLGLGFAVGIVELFVLRERFRDLAFIPHLLSKAVAIVAVMYVAFALLNLLDVAIDGITWPEYFAALSGPDIVVALAEGLAAVTFLLFFVQLDRLLGPGVLLGYMMGRYHRPRRESRIFLFIDLKGSTTLASEIEAGTYFQFLHQYFSEMSEPILETGAEVYQYVGDEIVLTWKMQAGLEEAAFAKAFFLIEDRIQAHRERFLDRFGAVPEFKAGAHAGEVIVAQIGELKSEVVYNGDVLNTTARIQALCNEFGHRFLVSRDLVDRMTSTEEFRITALGPVSVRGRTESVSLCAMERHGRVASPEARA